MLGETSIEALVITLKSIVGPIHKLLVAAVLITNVPAVQNWHPLFLEIGSPERIPLRNICGAQVLLDD